MFLAVDYKYTLQNITQWHFLEFHFVSFCALSVCPRTLQSTDCHEYSATLRLMYINDANIFVTSDTYLYIFLNPRVLTEERHKQQFNSVQSKKAPKGPPELRSVSRVFAIVVFKTVPVFHWLTLLPIQIVDRCLFQRIRCSWVFLFLKLLNMWTHDTYTTTTTTTTAAAAAAAAATTTTTTINNNNVHLLWLLFALQCICWIMSLYSNASRTHARVRARTHTHTHTHARTHARTHACTHARTHSGTHACTHKYNPTHRLYIFIQPSFLSSAII